MGLDSVELLMEWEKYFGIQIPDLVAEKINSVQNAVDSISTILNISNDSPVLKDKIFGKLQLAISESGSTNTPINQSDLVCKIFPDNDQRTWKFMSTKLDLEVPFPPRKPDNPIKTKILTIISWVPKFNYDELTFSQLTDAICGTNYEKLIDAKAITTKYEIYCVIMGLTVDKIGIDVYEVKPGKTFTDDFGID